MEKIIFPLKYMNVTQGMDGSYSHKGTFAIDYGTGGDEKVYAPFTGTIKKIYNTGDGNANGVWLLSNEKVLFADGSIDYAVMKCAHDNDISDLYIGKIIKQGQYFYDMGTAGNATGKHVHIEIAKGGKIGWYQNKDGNWMLTNSLDQTKAFFVPKDVKIKKDGGYTWKTLVEEVGAPVKRDIYVEQVEVLVDNLRARKTPSLEGEKLGYISKGIFNVLQTTKADDYTWFEVEKDVWIAYNEDWTTHLSAQKKEPTIEEVQEALDKAKTENSELKLKINELTNKNEELILELEQLKEENVKNSEYAIFTAPSKGVYYIELEESEMVYYKSRV